MVMHINENPNKRLSRKKQFWLLLSVQWTPF